MSNLPLPFDAVADTPSPRDDRDRAARARAVDPRFNVALEASAGTGKTRVLVDRYVNLLRAGVAPANILAMTFTRKAAAEMRARILDALRTSAERGEIPAARWRDLQERVGDITISTIDAFCLSLLREFPLEADLDPGFSVADDSEVPRLVDESLDRTLRACRAVARTDERVALVFAQLGEPRARAGLAALLARRTIAPGILERFLSRRRRDLTVAAAVDDARAALLRAIAGLAPDDPDDGEGLRAFVMSGPADPAFMLFVQQLERLEADARADRPSDPALLHATLTRARGYFLTADGQPRTRLKQPRAAFPSERHRQAHRDMVARAGHAVAAALRAYKHDLNVLVSGGVWRMYRIAEAEYRRTLDAHAMLDFSDLLLRTLDLLRRMEEFARSRYRLESRYHHVLVDEFQDTSRAQWELVSLLVESWGEGAGLAHANPLPPSIFIVGDRKQSIYGFRDADVSVLGDAVRFLQGLRPDGDVRRSISRSFRSVPALLSFVNDVCHDVEKTTRRDAFEYGEDDRFPVDDADTTVPSPAAGGVSSWAPEPVLGLVPGTDADDCADAVAGEIARLLRTGATVRDAGTGVPRTIRPSDVAILFRTRESHREFEQALARRSIASYVYKGLGFFDADEVRDVLALLGFLAEPWSDLRAAAVLRSGFARLTDEAVKRLGPNLSAALVCDAPRFHTPAIPADDLAVLQGARDALRGWLDLVDRIPPAELLDRVLAESAYVVELRGARFEQARENLKKVRALVRRAQNTGYKTLTRIVDHLDRLAVSDESNATIDAADAVHLMTVHASKGLEFPVVFIINLTRGTGTRRPPIRVTAEGDDEVSVSIGDYQAASDEDEAAQQREETKRLLYVALTRARDRLYLSAPLVDGALQPGRGSLAEVMPVSLLSHLGAPVGPVSWTSSTGRRHALAVVGTSPMDGVDAAAASDARESTADYAPLAVGVSPRRAASAGRSDEDESPASREARLFGALVHRALHRFGLEEGAPEVTAADIARLLRPGEEQLINGPGVFDSAADFFRDLRRRQEVLDIYRAGTPHHEIPFTLHIEGGGWTHGTIDCIVIGPPAAAGRRRQAVVLELKTGKPQPFHEVQATTYCRAAEALFPEATVEAVLVYRDGLRVLG